MENHPLNLAHKQYRRAEAHLKYNRFDEAMQCHHNAAELLLDAMKSTTSSMALESITLQHSYHLKQKDFIKNKKEQYTRVKKAVENLKQLGKDTSLPCNDNAKVQVAIYKVLNETDSLLDTLASRDSSQVQTSNGNDKVNTDGKIAEKTNKTAIDEIHALNHNMHSLVEKLMLQVETLKDDNVSLKERVKYLEKERTKYLNIQMSDFIQQNNFSNISLQNEGLTKEFVSNDASLIAGQSNKCYLAVNRPLQQPHFDLSAFKDE